MLGSVFQVAALATHGNAALAGRPVPDFYPQHMAFKFTEYVRFADLKPPAEGWKEIPFAADPDEWLAKLASQGCTLLRIARSPDEGETMPDRFAVAFVGGGGEWFVESVSPSGSDFWMANWRLGNREHPDQKIWQVSYGRVAQGRSTVPPETSAVAALSEELRQTLEEASAFSSRHDLVPFTIAFERALAALTSESEPELHGLAPPGQLPMAASRLAVASQRAWVFGGMGSWNDIVFRGDENAEYNRISGKLFELINNGIVEAINYPA
jgi:hypothetical protein